MKIDKALNRDRKKSHRKTRLRRLPEEQKSKNNVIKLEREEKEKRLEQDQ